MSDSPVKVDVSGIGKVHLLRALWAKSQVSAWCQIHDVYEDFDERAAKKAFAESEGSIGYFCGRVIKCNLKGDSVDPWGYDRDNGKGAFQKVVTEIRESCRIPPVKSESAEGAAEGATDEAATDTSSKWEGGSYSLSQLEGSLR